MQSLSLPLVAEVRAQEMLLKTRASRSQRSNEGIATRLRRFFGI